MLGSTKISGKLLWGFGRRGLRPPLMDYLLSRRSRWSQYFCCSAFDGYKSISGGAPYLRDLDCNCQIEASIMIVEMETHLVALFGTATGLCPR